jgi:hypothetical protein
MTNVTAPPVYGAQVPSTSESEYNALQFVIQQTMARLNVATVVKIVAVYGGGTGPVGTVDVQPLISQQANDGTTVPHTTIFNVPYFRYQGGVCAVIVDPQVGDVGFCVFADRDISTLQANVIAGNVAPAPPGSYRRFDFSDGLYIGGWCANLTPTSYVQVVNGSVNVVNPTQVNLQVSGGATAVLTSGGMKVTGTLEVTGNVTCDAQTVVKGLLMADASMQVTGTMSGSGGSGSLSVAVPIVSTAEISSNGHTLTAHTHGGVQTGGSSTSSPTG